MPVCNSLTNASCLYVLHVYFSTSDMVGCNVCMFQYLGYSMYCMCVSVSRIIIKSACLYTVMDIVYICGYISPPKKVDFC